MNIEPKVELKKYQISHIETQFENMNLGQNVISVETDAKIQKKLDKSSLDQIVELSLVFKNDQSGLLVFAITTKAKVVIPDASDETQINEYNKEAVRIAYNITRKAISEISSISNVNFLEIPEFDDVFKK
mgnify:CR=1 FL=1|nr:MAG TPA: Preprotein translocase subunit SecB [Caudoviricetes sp.]